MALELTKLGDIDFIDLIEVDNAKKELVRLWRNKENIRKFMLNQHYIEKKEHLYWVEGLKKNSNVRYWIVLYNKKPVGVVNLQNIMIDQRQSEWGIYLGDDDLRGKGIGKRVLYKFLLMFFEQMNFEKLVTKVLKTNIIAYTMYLNFSFRVIDTMIDKDNEIILMEYTKQEWDKYKERLNYELLN